MTGWNDLLKKRDTYQRGSDKWRELDRASFIVQGRNNINKLTRTLEKTPGWINKTPGQREDYARDRVVREFESLAKKQKETWRTRDIMQVRDDLKTIYGN